MYEDSENRMWDFSIIEANNTLWQYPESIRE